MSTIYRLSGTAAARPAAIKAAGARYYATDDDKIYFSTGTAWIETYTLDRASANGVMSGTLAARPTAGTCIGYLYIDENSLEYEAFPTAWAPINETSEELSDLGAGTAASLDVGTTALKVVQLDADAKLPAVDGSQLTGTIPAGVVVPYAGSSAPTGWLLAYGQAVSRETYADLFAAIADTYGVGDGSTTFNLPDLRGRVAAGMDNMGGSAASRLSGGPDSVDGSTLGAVGGAEAKTLSEAQIPSHTHDCTIPISSTATAAGSNGIHGSDDVPGSSTLVTTSTAGGGEAHGNVQPTIVLNYIIKT